MPGEVPWRAGAGSLTLTVRLTPKGGRDAIDGIEKLADGACVLKARVRTAPQNGEANAALLKLLAKTLSIAPGRVHLVGGATAGTKTLKIEGDGQALAHALARSLGLVPA
jgi:uncharacterized protein YggU (UPF0235/DUF167 family)